MSYSNTTKITLTKKNQEINCSVVEGTYSKPIIGEDINTLKNIESYKLFPCSGYNGPVNQDILVSVEWIEYNHINIDILNKIVANTPNVATPLPGVKTVESVVQPTPVANKVPTIRSGGADSLILPLIVGVIAICGVVLSFTPYKE